MMRLLVTAAVILLLLPSACGKEESKKVYSTPEGEVEVTRKEKGRVHEMTVKTEEGTATMKAGVQSIPEDLGVPIYPGVQKEETGTWSMTQTDEEGGAAFSSTILFSKDPIDKISAFYKEKLKGDDPQIFEMAMPTGKMVNISVEHGDTGTHVVLTENKDKGGTNIQITKTGK